MRWIETPMKVEDPLQGFVGMSDGVRGEEPFTSMEGWLVKVKSLKSPSSNFLLLITTNSDSIFLKLIFCRTSPLFGWSVQPDHQQLMVEFQVQVVG